MFDTLVESGSHGRDLKRKGSFMLGTLVIEVLLILAVFVAGILLTRSYVEQQNLELMTMVAPPPPPAPEVKKVEEAKPKVEEQKIAMTKAVEENLAQPTKPPEQTSVKANPNKSIPTNFTGRIGADREITATAAPSIGSGGVSSGGGGNPVPVSGDEPPPRPTPKPTPAAPKGPISGGVLSGKATSRYQPPYPVIAKQARQQGTVVVQITVDESGKVISAHAVSGPPLLQQAAAQAAYQWRFQPTTLTGQPVKVNGTISFNFTLNQ